MKIDNILVSKTLALVNQAAAFILAEAASFDIGKVEYKDRNDLVSYVDRASEAMLRTGLRAVLPNSGFIGEEGEDEDPTAEWRWIVDPLDGTTNFIHGIPAYCVSVALQRKEETVLGIVHDVPKGEVFHAILGEGAWLNGNPITVAKHHKMDSALIGMGFPRDSGAVQADYLAALGTLLDCSHGLRRIGAAALDLAYVACGRLDAFFELGLKPWDVAAGVLLVKEAGGVVSDLQSGSNFLFGKQIVASNVFLQPSLLLILNQHLGHWTAQQQDFS